MVMTMVRTNPLQVTASEFKAKCLALMDEVKRSRQPILITKNGEPTAELHPVSSARWSSPFGRHPGTRSEPGIESDSFVDDWQQ